MTSPSVNAFVQDLRLLGDQRYDIVQAVRQLVGSGFDAVEEEVKYGGIVFTAGIPFCGVFAYTAHVSVEFSSGARIRDVYGHLEGAGKGRRHIKLRCAEDVQTKRVAEYLPLALEAARAG